MTTDEVLNIALEKNTVTYDNFDEDVPVSLAPLFSKDLWGDCYVLIICEMFDRIEVDSFIDGVLTYRNRYYEVLDEEIDEDGEEIEPRLLIDDLVYVYDLKPVIKKRLDYPNNSEWYKAVSLEVHRFNRSTPLFKYLIKDYEAALNHLYLGWRNRERTYSTSEGTWTYFAPELDDQIITKSIYSKSDAIVYIKLEGALEFVITKEELVDWGVTEEQIFQDIFKHSYEMLKDGLKLLPKLYEGFDLQFWQVRHEKKPVVPTLIAGLHYWLPESDGEYGTIFVIPNEYTCYVFKFDKMPDLVFSIEFLLPHLKKYHSELPYHYELVDNSFYWAKNGLLEKFEASKPNEEIVGEVQISLSENMADTINRINRDKALDGENE